MSVRRHPPPWPLRCVFSGALALGCAATIDGTRGAGDASPVDASAPQVDVSAPPVDVAASRVALRVHVALGPLDPPGNGAEFHVRAEGSGGAVVEAITDGLGRAELSVLASAGPYAVTVARAGFTAVSVVDLPVPYDLDVYARDVSLERPPGVTTHLVRGAIAGRQSPMNSVVVQGFAGTTSTPNPSYEMAFETWNAAPPMRPIAIEYDPSMRMVNAVAPSPVPRANTDVTVDFALPSRPAAVESVNLGVELPFIGLVTPSSFDTVQIQGVIRFVASASGPAAIHLGLSDLRAPNAAGVAIWHLDSLTDSLLPDLYWASWTHRGPAPLRSSVALRPPFRGLRPSFGVVNALSVTASGASMLVYARSTRYDRAAFEVRSTSSNGRWVGYVFRGADDVGFPLPSLPSRVTLASIFPGGAESPLRVTACVLRSLPMAGDPWRSPSPTVIFDSEVTVCTAEGPALTRP